MCSMATFAASAFRPNSRLHPAHMMLTAAIGTTETYWRNQTRSTAEGLADETLNHFQFISAS